MSRTARSSTGRALPSAPLRYVRSAATAMMAALAFAPVAEAKTVGSIGGSGAYTLKCHWICHPRIKKARAQVCADKKGKSKIVYWESMPVACDPNAEGD